MKRKHEIPRITDDIATPEQLAAIRRHEAMGLKMTNMKRTMLNNVPVFEAFTDIMNAVGAQLQGKIPQRALTFFLYASPSSNQCMVCGTYFYKMLLDMGIDDFENFEFTEEENDLIAFAYAITNDANHVPDVIYERLQARYDDETMTVLVVNAVMTHANNLFNNITGVELDDHLKPYFSGEEEGWA